MAKKNRIKPGHLLRIESGEYSDYQVHGFFVAIKEFDPIEEVGNLASSNAIPKLLALGLLIEIEHSELYIDEYGSMPGVKRDGSRFINAYAKDSENG